MTNKKWAKTFINYFSAPKFDDVEITFRAALINTLLNLIFLLTLAAVFFMAHYRGLFSPTTFVLSLILIGASALRFYLRHGHVHLVSIILAFWVWLAATYAFLFLENGLRAPGYSAFLIFFVFFTGLLDGTRWAVFWASLSTVLNLIVIILESSGVFLTEVRTPNVTIVWFFLVIFSFGALEIMHYTLSNWKETMRLYRKEAEERRTKQEEIEELNAVLEERVIERTQQLEDVNRELESFAYSISHDLQAPVRAMRGFSELLTEELHEASEETILQYAERINKNAARMHQMIESLLQLSRVSNQEFRITEVDLSQIMRQLAADLQSANPDRRVEFVVRHRAIVRGDQTLLRILLQNLVGNAWKFTQQQAQARIEFDWVAINGEQQYFIKDNGPGFENQFAQKMFEPFQRLPSADEFEGSGVGLSTARRIVTRHGGKIWAEGEPGKGACIYFTLGQSL